MRSICVGWTHGVTRYQWLVLFVAWLGWVFDAMDATIYAIVLHPALQELLHAEAAHGAVTSELIGWYGAFAVLLAYALASFGAIATKGTLYQILNLTGSFGIIVVSFRKKAYQPIVLNMIWMLIALIALLSSL